MSTGTLHSSILVAACAALACVAFLGTGCARTFNSTTELAATRTTAMTMNEGPWSCHWTVRGKYSANVCHYVPVDAPRATIARRP
jgi:hypothetical protein